MHIMDGERVTKPKDSRRRHSDAFKQVLVERSLVPGTSVAAIAQDAGVNANLLFKWCRLHLQAAASAAGEEPPGPVLLPVTVVEPKPASAPPLPAAPTRAAPTPAPAARPSAGSIEINIRGTVVRVRQPAHSAAGSGRHRIIGLPANTRVWIAAGHTDMR